jgi:hypothetical protein
MVFTPTPSWCSRRLSAGRVRRGVPVYVFHRQRAASLIESGHSPSATVRVLQREETRKRAGSRPGWTANNRRVARLSENPNPMGERRQNRPEFRVGNGMVPQYQSKSACHLPHRGHAPEYFDSLSPLRSWASRAGSPPNRSSAAAPTRARSFCRSFGRSAQRERVPAELSRA